jgi:hypothetical protein|tara:strand:- start:254 stop:454 length:201 start_codon:yes stop_codon:yes gene_type:complete
MRRVESLREYLICINNPETLIKIDRFIHGLDYDEGEEKSEVSQKKGPDRVNVIVSKIKSMLNMYDK